MRRLKRLAVWLIAIVILVAAVAWFFREPLALRLMASVVRSNIESSLLDELPDGLHVALCGTGSPLPDADRSGPCAAVIAGERLFVVDAGSGASQTLALMRLPLGSIDGVLLTHFHSDHIDGLGELNLQRWINGTRSDRLPIYGPPGVALVVNGFGQAYSLDNVYRTEHHGEAVAPSSGASARSIQFQVPPPGTGITVIEESGLRVTAFRVIHDPVEPAVGYRFEYGGRSVVISGDTVKSDNLIQFAADADILVHEALSKNLIGNMATVAAEAGSQSGAAILTDILDYHTSPVEAAEVARDANVGQLVLTHIVPPLPVSVMERIFLNGVEAVFPGGTVLGEDGMLFSLESGSTSIERRELL